MTDSVLTLGVGKNKDNEQLVQTLLSWLAHSLKVDVERLELTGLPGDAGFRRYWRVAGVESPMALLAVYGPPEKEKHQEFVDIACYLTKNAIAAPKVVAHDFERGFMLVEDLGHQALFDVLSQTNVEQYYHQASVDLSCLAKASRPTFIASYDQASLMSELELFRQWFVPKLLNYDLSDDEHQLLDHLFEYLCNSALEQPQVCVMRDFHSRNMIVTSQDRLAYIDFQDALWGPCSYDLVSLLRDCYVRWPEEKVDVWCEQYVALLNQNSAIDVPVSKFRTWFDLMGLQRHIKVLGIFARLYLRDGKACYLDDLPLVIRYSLAVAERYPQTQAFGQWFKDVLLGHVEAQSWYQNYQTAGDKGCHLIR